MADNISKFVVEGEDRLTPIFDKVGKSVDSLDKRMGKMGSTLIASMLKTHVILKGFDQIENAFSKTAQLFKDGLQVNIDTEKTTLGIAATLATVYEFRDAVNGIELKGIDKFTESVKQSEAVMRRLTISAITTAANVKEVTDTFSATVAIGAQSGLNPTQVERMSSMVANASKVFGLQEGQSSQELRAILTGKIDKTSTIGTALGLGPGGALQKEFQAALGQGGDFLADFMDNILSEYTRAAETMSQKLSGMFDAAGETYKLFAKDITVSMGEELLKLKDVINNLFVVDKKKGIYQWGEDIKPLMGLLSYIGKLIGEVIVGAVKKVLDFAIQLGKYFEEQPATLNLIVNSIVAIYNVIVSLVTGVAGLFSGIIDGVNNLLSILEQVIGGIFKAVGGWMGLNDEVDQTAEKEKKIKGPTVLMKVWHGFISAVQIGVALISDLFKDLGTNIVHMFATLTTAIFGLFKGAAEMLSEFMSKGINSATRGIGTMVGLINKDLGDSISKSFENTGGFKIKTPAFMKEIQDVKKEIENAWRTDPEKMANTKKALADAFSSLDDLYNPKNNVTDELKKIDLATKLAELTATLGTTKKEMNKTNEKGLENEYNAIKKNYDAQLKLWDMYNSYGLIELETYYSRKQELTDESYQAEKKALEDILKMYGGKMNEAIKGKDEQEYSKSLNKVEETLNKLKELENQYFIETQKQSLDKEKGIFNARMELNAFAAKLEELKGDKGTANLIKMSIEIDELKFKTRNNPDMQELVESYVGQLATKTLLNNEEENYNNLLKEQSILLEKLNIEKQIGALGEIDYYKQVTKNNKASIDALKATIAAREELNSKNPEDIQKLDELRNKLLLLENTADPIKTKFDELFKNTFIDNFTAIIDGTKSVGDAFKDLIKVMEKELLRMVMSQLFTSLSQKIGGIVGGGSGGGWFDTFGSFASNLFGLMGKASGGMIAGPTLVGETGPELFFPNQKGFIMNAPKTNEYLQNSGAQSVNNVTINITSPNPESFRSSQVQIANGIQRAISKGNSIN